MIDYSLLIAALIMVESGGDDQALGDGGRSVGCLQISMGVIQDVNRIYGRRFLPLDRYNRRKSMEICRLYLMHWGSCYEHSTGKPVDAGILARIWNGGPTGWRKASTLNYRLRVMDQLCGVAR